MPLVLIIGSFGVAFLLTWGLNWLALIPWRRSAGNHWAERARLLYPAQRSARLNNWLIPVNLGVLSWLLRPEISFLFTIIPGFVGALLAGYLMSREVFTGLQFKLWLHLVVAGLLLFFAWWFLLLFAIVNMPDNFGWTTWLAAGGVLLCFLAFHFGFSLRLLRWFRILKPATEHLQTLVAEVSQKMAVPVRSTWILAAFMSNAAAFPQTGQLVFTDKLLAMLSDEEIKSVCAHELGHLDEPRRVLFARLLAAAALLPLIFAKPVGSFGENGANAFWLLLFVTLLLRLLGIRVARRMEKRADKIAAEHMADPGVYARALENLYQTNQVPAVMPRRSGKVHPDLYDRITAAGVTPDFPKPLPAKGQCWTSRLTLITLIALPLTIYMMKASAAILDLVTVHIKSAN